MYPQKYIEFLYEFHYTRDYFECHEVLEEYWKEETGMLRDSVWAGLIQFAVCLYHFRRGNRIGAIKLIDSCREKLESRPDEIEALGLSSEMLVQLIVATEMDISGGSDYRSFDLPIVDKELVDQLHSFAESIHPDAEIVYDVDEHRIIDRHMKKYR